MRQHDVDDAALQVKGEEHREHVRLLDDFTSRSSGSLFLPHLREVGGLRQSTPQPQRQRDRNDSQCKEDSPGVWLRWCAPCEVFDQGIHLSRHTSTDREPGDEES